MEWFAKKMSDCSQSHRDRTMRAMEKDLFPSLGNTPVAQLTAPDILRALRKIEARGALETAHRAKQTTGQMCRYAVATGRADRDSTSDLKGALSNLKKKHLAPITDPAEAGKRFWQVNFPRSEESSLNSQATTLLQSTNALILRFR
jgi:integrase